MDGMNDAKRSSGLIWRGVGDVVARLSRVDPDPVALVDAEHDIERTIGELDLRRRRLANALLDRLGPGDRVAVVMPNRVEAAEAIYGIATAGMVQVNVNDGLTPAEIAYILSNAGARLALVDHRLTDKVASAAPDLDQLVVGGSDAAFERLLAASSDAEPDVAIDVDDPALLIYTSGTTGRPKGVALSHRNVLEGATNFLLECYDASGGTLIACVPYFHAACVPYLAAVIRRMTVVICRFEAAKVASLTDRHRATHISLPPTAVALLLDAVEGTDVDLSSLRQVVYGGSPMPEPVLRRAVGALGPIFCQTYGMTETGSVVTVLRPEDHDLDSPARLSSCGQQITRVDLQVVDLAGAPVPDGTPGELVARGPNVSRSYWNDPESTAGAHYGDWFRTGDMVVRAPDGFFTVVGRLKDMIISGGTNVYPVEIEKVLEDHPHIEEVAVIGVSHPVWSETVAAVVVGDPSLDVDALRAWCNDRLAPYKQPRLLFHVDALPRNAIGKVDKPKLREMLGS
jgi:acyl-CoA synthetase (AMP-forming)/AMP-acid ligase II